MLHTRFSPLLSGLAPSLVAVGLLGMSPAAHAQEVAQAAPPVQYAPAPGQAPTVVIQQQYPPPVYQQAPVYQPYQQGQPVYVQPPVYQQQPQPQGPRVIKDWDSGQPIPPGYHVEEHVRKGLIIGGAVTFASTYLLSALVAASVESVPQNGNSGYGALYVPGVGPFILMAQGGNIALGDFLLAIDGIAQLGGIAMFAAGIAYPRTELVRNDLGGLHFHFAPIVARDHTGMGIVGTF